MAKLSNINGRFAVEDDGAIQFNGQAGTDGYVLESRGDSSPPVWTDRDTGRITGSGAANRVTYWTGIYSISSDDNFRFDGTNVAIGGAIVANRKLAIYNTNAGNELEFIGADYTNIYSNTDSTMAVEVIGDGALLLATKGGNLTIATGGGATFTGAVEINGIGTWNTPTGGVAFNVDAFTDGFGVMRFRTNGNAGKWDVGMNSSNHFYIGNNGVNTALEFTTTSDATFAGTVTAPSFKFNENIYKIESTGATRGLYSAQPHGGDYYTQTSSKTGYLKIVLPPTTNVDDMVKFTVDIYLYGIDTELTAHIGGYLTSSLSWGNSAATIISTKTTLNYTVRFGNDGTNYCVYIGEADTTWSYPQVVIRNFFAGYGAVGTDDYLNEWTIDFTTTLGTISETRTNNFPLSSLALFPWTINGNDIYNANSGNVGIGTTDPNVKLRIAGTQGNPASSGSTSTGFLSLYKDGASHGLIMGVQGVSPYGSWIQSQDKTNHAINYNLLLNPNGGKVGIGTTNYDVEGRLDLRMDFLSENWIPDGTSAKWGEVWDNAGAPGTYFNDVMLHVDTNRNGGATGGVVGIAFSPGWQGHQNWGIYSFNTSGSGFTSGDLAFTSQLNDGTIIERVRFNGVNGNVGIGTTSPDAKLEVRHPSYANTNETAIFTNGSSSGRIAYDTLVVNQTDVATLSLVETPGTAAQEQKLTFSVGDNKAVIRTANTSGGMYFNVQASLTAPGYQATSGLTAIHILNNADVIMSQGRVAIGTTVANGKLSVAADDGTTTPPLSSGIYVGPYQGNTAVGSAWSYSNGGATYTDFSSRYDNSDSYMRFIMKANGTPVYAMTIRGDGRVGVIGTFTAAGDVVAFSDKKLKKNIKTLDGSKVYKMRGVSFDRIDTDKASSGVIAQELQEIAPELVSESEGTLGVAYGNLSGYLIEAIKELKAEIEELKSNKCNCNK